MRRYRAAIRERNIQVEGHRGLTTTLPEGLATVWEGMCLKWERASHPKAQVKNPYETNNICEYYILFYPVVHHLSLSLQV